MKGIAGLYSAATVKKKAFSESALKRRKQRNDLAAIATALKGRPTYPDRIPSTIAGRTQLIDLGRVSHFYASDKLTYAATAPRPVPIEATLNELEERMDPNRFLRIHRAVLVNVAFVAEVKSNVSGMIVKLMDAAQTEIPVARDRAKTVRERLGL